MSFIPLTAKTSRAGRPPTEFIDPPFSAMYLSPPARFKISPVKSASSKVTTKLPVPPKLVPASVSVFPGW